jgi:hypothetical protein
MIPTIPEDLRAKLKLKSSRNPESHFSAKLHLLLSFVDQHPELVHIGCAWVTDGVFKMHKAVLAQTMEIKLNSLNVDLKDLGFRQDALAPDGWSCWSHPQFTRAGNNITRETAANRPARPCFHSITFQLGHTSPEEMNHFLSDVNRLWGEFAQTPSDSLSATSFIIGRSARVFKAPVQTLEDATDVICHLLEHRYPKTIAFDEFARFLAMFGPAGSIMAKIKSLINCSNLTGEWFYFEPPGTSLPLPHASFDNDEPNCLVYHAGDGSEWRGWNLPLVEAGEAYTVGMNRERYADWNQCLQASRMISVHTT